jgi:hypothetical protein
MQLVSAGRLLEKNVCGFTIPATTKKKKKYYTIEHVDTAIQGSCLRPFSVGFLSTRESDFVNQDTLLKVVI